MNSSTLYIEGLRNRKYTLIRFYMNFIKFVDVSVMRDIGNAIELTVNLVAYNHRNYKR